MVDPYENTPWVRVLDVLWIGMILFLLSTEFKEMKKSGLREYVKGFGNMLDWTQYYLLLVLRYSGLL